MIKRLSLIVAILMIATSAFAWTSTDNGPVHIETCYITDMGDLVSGDNVILQTSSPTYWGREVTQTTSQGKPIYGIILGDPQLADCASGTWVRVQTYGYCPIVKLDAGAAVTANSSYLVTSDVTGRSQSCTDTTPGTGIVTGSVVALETRASDATGKSTIKAFLGL